MGIALEAWNGSGDWAHGRQYRRMRALFPMYETRFQFVALKSANIHSLADMSGKRIGVGPRTGTGAIYVSRFFSTLNIDAMLSYGTWNDLAVQLERGEVDGLAVAGSITFSGDLRARGKASDPVHLADIGRDQQTAGYVSRAHRHGNPPRHLSVIVGALSDRWLLQFRRRRQGSAGRSRVRHRRRGLHPSPRISGH